MNKFICRLIGDSAKRRKLITILQGKKNLLREQLFTLHVSKRGETSYAQQMNVCFLLFLLIIYLIKEKYVLM